MSKTIVFTLGFDVSAVVAKLSEIGLGGDEEVVVVTVKSDSQRGRLSVSTVKNYVDTLNTRGMRLKFKPVELDPDSGDPMADLARLFEALKDSPKILFELSGGLRYSILLCYIVASLLREKVEAVHTRLETSGRPVSIPILSTAPPSPAELRILRELSHTPKTQKQLAQQVGIAMSTVSRTLASLAEGGLVAESAGKPKQYVITELGKIYLKKAADPEAKQSRDTSSP